MYPKSTTSRTRSNSNKQTARDQLSELLINKFRNRYNINVSSERDLDATIQNEVTKVVKQEASVTERDLNELDRKI
jgi:hypothetical protein